jgi:hypothetical protein
MIKYVLTATICFFVLLVIYDIAAYLRNRFSPEKSFQRIKDHIGE